MSKSYADWAIMINVADQTSFENRERYFRAAFASSDK